MNSACVLIYTFMFSVFFLQNCRSSNPSCVQLQHFWIVLKRFVCFKVCQHCYSRLVQPNIPSLQTEFFSPRFYQVVDYRSNLKISIKNVIYRIYLLNCFILSVFQSVLYQHLQGMENQEVETTDINLDTVFQIADDVMQMFSSVQTVQTPVNPVSVLKSAPGTCKATPRDDKPSTAPSNATPMVMAVSNVPAYKDESVTSVSEQIPGDAIVMVSLNVVAS